MKRSKHILAGCLLSAAICGMALFAQGGTSSVERKRDELSDLRATIRESETRLKRLEARARKSGAAAAESRRQAVALDSLILLLEEREGKFAGEMIAVRSRRDSLDRLVSRISDEYLRAARLLYRRRLLAPSASMLLMPEEHRRLALAERLFARYARNQKERARKIIALRDSLDAKDSVLALRRDQQLVLLSDQRDQMKKLEHLEARYAGERRRAESEKGTLEEFIRRKSNEARQIEGMITRLVQREATPKRTRSETRSAEKPSTSSKGKTKQGSSDKSKAVPATRENGDGKGKEKEKSTTRSTASSDESTSTSSRSTARPTSFRAAWPVSGRTVLHGYGERRNSQTNTVTFNPGVNIAAKSGTSVSASGAGKVSLVSWLPSYGTVVIVEHDGGWRTVYANLASADVSEGARVTQGSRIGRVGPSADGEYLHFEVWHDQTRMNPITILR